MNKTTQDILSLIAQTPKGAERKKIVNQYRDKISITGGFCVLYATQSVRGKTAKETLSHTYVGAIERTSARTGTPDGLGNLGGLGEYATPEIVAREGINAVGKYDNVGINVNGTVEIIHDINLIARNNAAREAKEELQNLGISDYKLPKMALERVDLPGVTDDNFIINRWNGTGAAYAVTPSGHILDVGEQLLDRLTSQSENDPYELGEEAKGFRKMPIFEALKHWGKKLPVNAPNRSEDGRDLTYDYRYPHEYLLTWKIAAKVLGGKENDIIRLGKEVQMQTAHLIDLKDVARQMDVPLKNLGMIIGLSEKGVEKLIKTMESTHLAYEQKRKQSRNLS